VRLFLPEERERWARVLGVRRDRFVEFRFILGDENRSVDLVMPLPELIEFCRCQNARLIPPDGSVAAAFDALCRAEGINTPCQEPQPTGGASREH